MKIILYLFSVLLLFSCSNPNKELIITFENSYGIIKGDPVVLNDQTIGKVTKVSLNGHYKPMVSIYLKEIDHLPKDSEFTIGSKDLIIRAILVTPGKSRNWLKRTDKILGNPPSINQTDASGIDVFDKRFKIEINFKK